MQTYTTNGHIRVLQFTTACHDRNDAAALLQQLLMQDSCLGGRTLEPSGQLGKDSWRVQVFFATDLSTGWPEAELPDGCRVIMIPDCLHRTLGIRLP